MSLEKVRWDEFDKMHVVKKLREIIVAGGKYRSTSPIKKV